MVGFLAVGPLVLPLVWLNPGLNRKHKAAVTAGIIIISCILGAIFVASLRSVIIYYREMLKVLQ